MGYKIRVQLSAHYINCPLQPHVLYRELINPSEVVVNSSHEVLLAQPVVTPIEQLRRKDKEVARALEEKQKLIEEILNIPHEELDTIAAEVN